MPPRSARKGAAAAKKQSPRPKQSTPPPPVEDADIADPAAVVVKAGEEAEEDASLPAAAMAGEDREPAAVKEEVAAEKEMDAEEKEMDVDKEGETRGEVENDHGDVVDKVGNDEGTARVTDHNDEGEEEADDEENEEEADDEENEEDSNGKENEEDANDKENEEEADDEEADVKENEEDANDKENEEEADDEDDPALYMQAPLTERKTQKHFEIFVGGLDKEAVEEDLIKAFGAFGEIQSVRIVKHPVTQKSKGYAFVRYVSMENAKKVLTELKDGTEVKGKQIRISASDDNDTLYLGNICKTWTKDQVTETLKGYGIEQVEDILLPKDPKNEGRIKGFGFVEFSSHSDAMAAFQRLRKPDALFGRDISAKVSFAQTPLHPSEESLLQVRTVYLEGIPKSWDEGKVEELCKQHGEIEKIQLPKNSSSKRKDYGFVEFSSRDSALACVEGINNAQFGEGDVKAKLAKPAYKGRLAKQSARGGYKVKKDGEATDAEAVGQSKKKNKAKSKEENQPKLKSSNGSKPTKSQGKGSKDRKGKMLQSSKGKKRGRQGMDIGASDQPSKRTRNNQKHGKVHGRPSTASGNKRRSYSQQTMYGPSYATPGASYTAHAYAGTSGSHYRRSDMEPHAGFLPAAQQVQNPYGYDLRRGGAYDSQLRGSSGYAGAAPLNQTPYPQYSTYAPYEVRYTYPSHGAYGYRGPYY